MGYAKGVRFGHAGGHLRDPLEAAMERGYGGDPWWSEFGSRDWLCGAPALGNWGVSRPSEPDGVARQPTDHSETRYASLLGHSSWACQARARSTTTRMRGRPSRSWRAYCGYLERRAATAAACSWC